MIEINNDLILSNKINLDINYGPYSSATAAHAALEGNEKNKIGVTVGIQTGSTIEEYWYQGGTTEQYLVKKQSDGISSDMTFDKKLQTQANINNQEPSQDGRLGYVVLQPEKQDEPTTTFAAQIANKPNTIFEIRDVFDLGTNVTLPNNCTLKFNGGILNGGPLDCNGAKLEGNVSLNCIVKNVTADAIKLSWFCSDETIDNINNAITSASYCDCKVVDGCNKKISINETIQVGSVNKVSLINLIIDYTATQDNDNLFVFDAGEQQSGYTPTIKDCTFTLTNPTDYENVHCIHLRKWYDTTSSKIDNVLVVGFSGYMFICESYLQEFEFNRFKGNNVGGLISFNKEYGTANAFGDRGAGSSNIIRIINSGIDGKLNHNNTISDLVDLTAVMELYINNVVVQGNIYQVEPTKNAINITKRSTAITTAVVTIFNLWFEWDNKIPVGQTGNGQAADVVFPNGTAMTIGAACNVRFLSGGISYIKILGQNVYLEINAGGLLNKDNAFTIAQDAYPTIKLIGTGRTENALMKIKDILDKAYFIFDFIPTGIPVAGSATQPQFMFAKSGMIDSLDGIFNNPSINVTSSLVYVDGQLVVRQQPTNSANAAYFRYTYAINKKFFPFGNYPKFIHIIYRTAPNVAVTNDNKDTFKFIHDHGDLLRSPMNNTYREPLFEVGQSTNIEDAEWKELIVPFDINIDGVTGYYSISPFISDGADMTIDIAVSRLYFGDTELVEDVKINPKEKTELLVIDYTQQNFTNLQKSKMVMTGAPAGYAIYDTSDGKNYIWNGSAWTIPFADRILKATTKPSGGFLPNTYYELGTLTGTQSFSLAAATDSTILNQYFWTFETGSTPPTVTWPTGLTWQGGSEPTLAANKHYEISVINNYAVFVEI